jgi:hypothetical protein
VRNSEIIIIIIIINVLYRAAPVQTVPGAHPASYTMGTGSFPCEKRLGSGVYHLPPPSVEEKERIELYLYTAFGPSWPLLG